MAEFYVGITYTIEVKRLIFGYFLAKCRVFRRCIRYLCNKKPNCCRHMLHFCSIFALNDQAVSFIFYNLHALMISGMDSALY